MVSLAGSVCLATLLAQDPVPAPVYRTLVADITASPIDRGLRDNDPPREPALRLAVRPEPIEGPTARSGQASGNAGGGSSLPYIPGSVIVKFRSGTSFPARQAMLAQVDGSPTQSLPYANFDIVTIDDSADPEAVARALSAMPDVEYAQARYRIYPLFVPNDPLYSRQWNYPAIDMERAWDINPGATPAIVVAVLDTGVAYRSAVVRYNARAFRFFGGVVFPALGPIDVPFAPAPDLDGGDRFVSPRDFIWNDTMPLDLDGHGTHVSGTVGQLTNNGVGVAGMAFNVRIMPIKVIDTDWDLIFGSPFFGTDDVVARAVRYAVDSGARVLNMSIGRTGGAPATVIHEAIAYAVSRGAFVAVGAGNEFLEGNPISRLAEFAPQIDGMVSVGAVGRNRDRASYSTTGPYVEIVAPGGDVRQGGAAGLILQQTYDFDFTETYLDGPARYRAPRFDAFAFQFFQGTSMATPHVAGFAALLMQQGITSPAALEAVMKRYATDLGPPGRDDEYGHGLINPRASLRGLGLAK